MHTLAGALTLATALVLGETPLCVDFSHVCTFGSKKGVHPPTLLNRRVMTAAVGKAENPYGLVFPVAVASDLHHRVWITDSGTASVHVFDMATGAYREIRRVADAPLQQPAGVAVDKAGRIFVSDAGDGRVFVFDENGEFDHLLTKPQERLLQGPSAIAFSEDGKTVYVADPPRNVVVELNREGEVDGTIQLPPEFSDPAAISVVNNQIYVLGNRQHRVGIFSPGGKLREESRFEGIACPTALAYDARRGRFLVADPRWMVVQIFDEEGRNVGSFGRSGQGVDQMEEVDFLHVDPQGLHFLVDSHHGKVLVFADSACLPR